jgi:hypothetical protein
MNRRADEDMHKQTDKGIDRQANREIQTDGRKIRQIDKQITDRPTDGQIDCLTNIKESK